MGKQTENVKIYYSKSLVSAIKKLVEQIMNSADRELMEEYYAFYFDVSGCVERIKNILSIQTVQQVLNKSTGVPQIIEIGSGIGIGCLITKALTEAQVIGMEPAPKSYRVLHECIREVQKANQHLPYESLNCGGEEIPYENGSVDFIYSFEVLEHVNNPEKVLGEIYRVLKPGACAYIATCNYDSFWEGHYKCFWNPFIGVKGNRKRFIKKGYSLQFLSELNFLTKKKIKTWSRDIGFRKIEFKPTSGEAYKEYRIFPVFPVGFRVKASRKRTKKFAKVISNVVVNYFLSKIDREYKLCFLLIK